MLCKLMLRLHHSDNSVIILDIIWGRITVDNAYTQLLLSMMKTHTNSDEPRPESTLSNFLFILCNFTKERSRRDIIEYVCVVTNLYTRLTQFELESCITF